MQKKTKTTSNGSRCIHCDAVEILTRFAEPLRRYRASPGLAALAIGLFSRVMFAQDVDRVTDASIKAAIAQTSRSGSVGVAFTASRDNAAQFILNRRTSSSAVEMHCAWDDVIIVKEGTGTLRSSRKFRGLARYSSWEWRAKELVVAREVPMQAGDILRIVAGVGHQIVAASTTPLIYLVIKVRSVEATPCGSLPQLGR